MFLWLLEDVKEHSLFNNTWSYNYNMLGLKKTETTKGSKKMGQSSTIEAIFGFCNKLNIIFHPVHKVYKCNDVRSTMKLWFPY